LQPIEKNVVFYQIDAEKKFAVDEKKVAFIIDEISELKNKLVAIKKSKLKSYDIFKKLIYPYQEVINYTKNKQIKYFDADDDNLIENIKSALSENCYIFRPNVELDDANIYYVEEEKLDNIDVAGLVVKLSEGEILTNILLDCKKNLLTFLGFLEEYNTPEKALANQMLWKLYQSLKK
jgi:rubrerythrin